MKKRLDSDEEIEIIADVEYDDGEQEDIKISKDS